MKKRRVPNQRHVADRIAEIIRWEIEQQSSTQPDRPSYLQTYCLTDVLPPKNAWEALPLQLSQDQQWDCFTALKCANKRRKLLGRWHLLV
jgi:hypothetical protein